MYGFSARCFPTFHEVALACARIVCSLNGFDIAGMMMKAVEVCIGRGSTGSVYKDAALYIQFLEHSVIDRRSVRNLTFCFPICES